MNENHQDYQRKREPDEAFDVIIIGAGPAGCTAALSLAPSGLRIALVDKAKLPHDKICGGGLSGTVMNALKYLPGNVYEEFINFPHKMPSLGIRFIAPDFKELDLPFLPESDERTSPSGYICKRIDFDRILLRQAGEYKNIRIIPGFLVEHIHNKGDGIIVSGGKKDFFSTMLIGADGIHSVTGKLLAGNRLNRNNYCLGIRAYYKGISGLHPPHFIELHFIRELLPFYLWIFPLNDGLANVGIAMMYNKIKKEKVQLARLMKEIIDKHPRLNHRFKNACLLEKTEAHGLCFGPENKKISGERFLLAGDAASLINPFTGEGIGNAMLSGKIAAKVILESFEKEDFSSGFLKKYDLMLGQSVSKDLKISHTIHRLCRFPWLFNMVVGKALKNDGLKTMLTRMYLDQDIKAELTRPGFYLRLLFK